MGAGFPVLLMRWYGEGCASLSPLLGVTDPPEDG